MTYRLCASCGSKVPYSLAIYRLEVSVGPDTVSRVLGRTCLRQAVK